MTLGEIPPPSQGVDYRYRISVKVSPSVTKHWRFAGNFETIPLTDIVTQMRSDFELKAEFNCLFLVLKTAEGFFYDDTSLNDEQGFIFIQEMFRNEVMNILRQPTNRKSHSPVPIFGLSLELKWMERG